VTGLDLNALSAMVGRQLPVFSLIVPFWLIAAYVGVRKMLEVWPAILVAGVTFAIPQFLVSNYHGPWLVDIVASACSMLCLAIFLRLRRGSEPVVAASVKPNVPLSTAVLPWVILTVVVFAWGTPQVKNYLNGISAPKFPIPGLDKMIERVPPVVAKATPEAAVYVFTWLSATGTAILVAALITGFILRYSIVDLAKHYVKTIAVVWKSLLTIAAMLALGFTTRYSGTDTTMGIALAGTGWWFPFFSPLLGWLGVALTGSDTASNVLFGNLQQITAQQVGISPVLAAAANTTGGVMGKMIDAQSIVVAGVATGQHGNEGQILRAVFWHSLALASLVGLLVLAQAYLFPGVVP